MGGLALMLKHTALVASLIAAFICGFCLVSMPGSVCHDRLVDGRGGRFSKLPPDHSGFLQFGLVGREYVATTLLLLNPVYTTNVASICFSSVYFGI